LVFLQYCIGVHVCLILFAASLRNKMFNNGGLRAMLGQGLKVWRWRWRHQTQRQGQRLENWFSRILEDKDIPEGHTLHSIK